MSSSWAQGCRSECNIEGDRKYIKFQMLAFDILKFRGLILSNRFAGRMFVTSALKCTTTIYQMVSGNFVAGCFIAWIVLNVCFLSQLGLGLAKLLTM